MILIPRGYAYFSENVLTVRGRKDDLQRKLEAFGCACITSDGHNIDELISVFDGQSKHEKEPFKPQTLIANTIKGFGLKCMENVPRFHFRIPTADDLKMGNRYE